MADGVEVGRAFVSIAGSVNAAALAREGQAAASAFVKGFAGVANAGLATIESKAAVATKGLGLVATSGTRAFSAVSSSASVAQSAINAVYSGLTRVGGAAGAVGLALPRALGMASEAARGLSNEIGLSAFRLQMMGGVLTGTITAPILAATKAIVSFGLQTAMSLENAEIALAALLPPGYDVEALLNRLKTLAISSPVFAIDQLEDFTKRLVGATVPIEKTEQILAALNRVMITFGVTGANAGEVLLGVQQVFQKGKVSSEELTRQISQQLPIWALLSEASGMTQAELVELTVAGEFTSEMFGDMLIKIGQLPKIMAGAEGGVTTLSARLSVIQEAFQQTIATRFLEFFPQIKEQLDRLLPVIDEFTVFVVRQIPKMIDLLVALIDKFLELRAQFDALDPATQRLLIQFAKFAPVVGPALLIIGALASSLSALLGLLAFAINPVTVFFAAVSYGFMRLYQTSYDFRSGMSAFRNSFMNDFQEQMPGAMREFNRAVSTELLPALADLARAFGFSTWQDFGSWLGNTLPKLLMVIHRSAVRSIKLLTRAVNTLSAEWVKLDEQMQKNIIRFGLMTLAMIPLLPLLAGVFGALANITRVLAFLTSPIGLLLIGLGALAVGLKYLWETSESFRTVITSFAEAFKRSWAREMPAAIAAFKAAVVSDLLPALEGLARALGFTGWDTFAVFLGTAIPKLMARAVRAITTAVGLISTAIRYLTKVWLGLSEETQQTIIKMAGIGLLLLPFLPLLLAVASAVSGVTIALIGLGSAIIRSVFGLLGGLFGLLQALAGFIGGVLSFAFGALTSTLGALFGVLVAVVGVLFNLSFLITTGLVGAAVAAAYGIYRLWQTSAQFRDSVAAFADGFESAWGQRIPSAVASFSQAVSRELLPAILHLGRVFGLDTWEEFSFWLGTLLPRALGFAITTVTHAVGIISDAINFFAEKWGALSDVQKENIKTMLTWAAGAAALVFVARTISGALLGLFGPWGLLLIGVTAGLKYLWDSSATLREGVLAFAAAFGASWTANVVPALQAFWVAIKTQLGPALLGLAEAFGLPHFATFKDFMIWFGTVLPELIGKFVEKLTIAIPIISGWIRDLTDRWNGLDDSTKRVLEKIAVFIAIAAPFSGAILSVFGALGNLLTVNPGLLILGLALLAVGAGIKYLWDHSQDFRDGIHAFQESFKKTWGEDAPGAVQRLKDAFNNDLAPAFRDLAKSVGFDSFKEFGEWLGGKFASGAVSAIDGLTWAVHKLADGFRFLADHMPTIREHISKFTDKIGDLKDKWDDLSGAQKTALGILAGGGIAGSLIAGGPVDFAKAGVSGFGGALGAIAALGPVGIAGAFGLGLVATGFIEGYRESDTFKKKVDDFKDGFKEGWQEKLLEPLKKLLVAFKGEDGKGGIVGALTDFFVVLGGGDAKTSGERLSSFLSDAIEGFTKLVDVISMLIRGLSWVVVGFNLASAASAGFHFAAMEVWNQFAAVFNAIADMNNRLPDALRLFTLPNVMSFSHESMQRAVTDAYRRKEEADRGADYLIAQANAMDELKRARGYAIGGSVLGAGTGTSDSILARLSNGEFVMRSAAVKFWGTDFMSALNSMSPSRVRAATPTSSMTDTGGPATLAVNVYLDGEMIGHQAQVVVDANHAAAIRLMRNGRGLR